MNDELEWSTISRKMMMQSPVFVVGVPRSGTSLVYRTLQMHSSFKIGRKGDVVDLTETHIFGRSLVAVRIAVGENDRLRAYMLGDEKSWQELCDLVAPIQRYQGLIAKYSPLNEHSSWRWTLDRHVARVYFAVATRARAVRRIVEKTPGHVSWLSRIRKTFPEAKMIFVGRHPIDVYASYRKRLTRDIEAGVDQARLSWLRIRPERFCVEFSTMVRLAQLHKATNDREMAMIRYEDMTGKPAHTAAALCDFLGEPREARMVSDVPATVSRYRPAGTPVEALMQAGISSRKSTWEEHMTVSEAQLIEDTLKRELTTLGYSRYT